MNNRYTFALSTTKKAGQLLLKAAGVTINSKNNDIQDIVTSADLEVNKFITEQIIKNYPNETIYSEEESDIDVSSGSYWSIDPIDGTSSFSRNIPHFAVVLTYVENGVPIVGTIYNPRTSEMYSFEKDKGAFLNEKPVHTSNISDLAYAFTFLRIGRDQSQWDWGMDSYKFLLSKANKTYSFGSSSLDMCFVGAGRIEACIYGTLTTINIAGALGFVTEAGGIIVDKNGNKITSLSKEKQIVIAVNNENLLSELKKGIILTTN